MYTAGYRYDWSNHKIMQTGVLSIDAEPTNVEVFLNDVRIEKSMPIRLPNRAPGTYKLVMKKSGYREWSKDIIIESRKTTYVRDITLFKMDIPEQILNNFDKNIICYILMLAYDYRYVVFDDSSFFVSYFS